MLTTSEAATEPTRPAVRASRAELAVALLLTMGALAVHLTIWQSAGGLWRDEVNTVVLNRDLTVGQVWANLQYDSFPLLWHLILRGWMAAGFGGSDLAIRGIGLVAGLATVAALWWNGRRFRGGRGGPVVGLLLLQYVGSFPAFGDSIRGYGFGACAALLTLGVIWDVAVGPASIARTVAAFIVALVGVHLTFHNSPVLLACCAGGVAVALRHRDWRRVATLLGIGAVCGATMLVYAPVIARAHSFTMIIQKTTWDWRLAWQELVAMFASVLNAGSAEPNPPRFTAWVWLLGAATSIVMAAAVIVRRPAWWGRLEPRQRDAFVYAMVTGVVGAVACAAFLRVLRYELQPWYFLLGLTLIGGCLDAAYAAVLRGRTRSVVLAGTLLAACVAFRPTWIDATVRRTDVDLLSTQLRASTTADDIIVTAPWHLGVSLTYYYHGPATVMAFPPVPFLGYQQFDQLVPFMRDPELTRPAFDRIDRALRGGHRVWVVTNNVQALPGPPLLPAPSDEHGWSGVYYEQGWQSALLLHLSTHARSSQVLVPPYAVDPQAPVSLYEDEVLVQADGWRG